VRRAVSSAAPRPPEPMSPAYHPVHSNTLANSPPRQGGARPPALYVVARQTQTCAAPERHDGERMGAAAAATRLPRQLHADPGTFPADSRAPLTRCTRGIHTRARISATDYPAHGVEARQPSPTTRSEPQRQAGLAHHSCQQTRRQAGMVVRRPEKYLGVFRLPSSHDPALVRQDHVAQAFTELVAGGFEIHLPSRFASVSRGPQ
jgi:hypothetical protein